MLRSTVLLLAAAVSLAAVTGCSSADDPEMTKVEKSCVKTACDARMNRDSQACSACMDACFNASFDCDPSERCEISCGSSSTCSDSERSECVEQGFTVELPAAKSDALADACRRMFARNDECGVRTAPFSAYDCEIWAKTERPERAKDYECVAALPCDDDGASCEVAPSDFGDRLCDAMSATCDGFCTDDVRAALNLQGAWLKDGVMQAAMTCAKQESCGDARECFQAWTSAARL